MAEPRARETWTPELAILVVLSACMHFWNVFYPNAVVFDELHYERQAGHYLAGTYYFDLHPPLGKLLYATVAKLFDVPAATLLAAQPAPVLRVLPALCGTLLVPLVYVLLRQLGALRLTALLGGTAILLDNALLTDSRFVLLEPLMICFALTAVVLFLAGRNRTGVGRTTIIVCAATFAGCAISVKWTGISALGLIVLTLAWDVRTSMVSLRRAAVDVVLLIAIPIAVYLGTYAVHFSLLPKSGDDNGALSTRFRETLIGNPVYRPDAHMSFFAKLAEVHAEINRGNYSLEGVSHPAASPWYTWPIMKHPIALWLDRGPPQRSIILLGNPIVWWGGLVSIVMLLLFLWRGRRPPEHLRFGIMFATVGVLSNYLPFIPITRVMYLYHYLFALVWLVVFGALAIEAMHPANRRDDLQFSNRRRMVGYGVVAALIVAGFVYFAPLTYGWPLSQRAYDARFEVLHPGS